MIAYMRGLLRCRPTSNGQCEKPLLVGRQQIQIPTLFSFLQPNANEGKTAALSSFMEHKYQVAFLINGKQFNAWFFSPIEFSEDPVVKNQFRSSAEEAALAYIAEARRVPKTGFPEALAIWPEILPVEGVIQPLDAFEIK